jgi:hypothetical protein
MGRDITPTIPGIIPAGIIPIVISIGIPTSIPGIEGVTPAIV